MKVIVENSSSIKSFEYVDSNLIIEFNGSKYVYWDVSPELVKNFTSAESKGIFFAANIKNKFVTEKIIPITAQ